MIVTFYSYKGGVGRSMALANVAQWYRLQGLKVVMVDWDLEAPGLESFFTADRDEREGIQGKLGLIDLIATYRDLFPGLARPAAGGGREAFVRLLDEALPPVRHMLVPIKPAGGEADDSVGGGLWLLSAGCRGGTRFDAYAETVQRLDWDELYSRFEGEAYFEWMRRQLNDPELADVVLIDSRTGVAEMSGVCTRQLADTVVVLSAPNDQNLDGVAQMARSFTRAELQEVRGPERPIEMVMVPSRIHEAEGRPIDIFEAKFRERLDRYLPAAFKRAGTGFERLRIPYISAYSFAERLAVGDPEGVRSLQQAYANLAVHIALLAKPKTMLRRRCSEALKQAFGLPVVAIAMLDMALLDEADAFGRRLEDEGIETLPLPPGEPEAVIAALAGGQAGHAVVFAGEQNSVESNADQLPRARALWRQARERGLCLHFWAPSASAGVLPVGVNRLDAHADFDKVLALLSSPCRARPVPNLAPPAPVAFVGRLDLLAKLKFELLQREARDPIALVGLGGSGKSSLLRMLCQDDELVANFDGGILWLALGPSADLLDGLCKQLLAFEPGTQQPADIDEAQRRLAELLATRRCLIVADDAWDRGQLERLPSGPQCRLILSTRTNDVALAIGARVFAIEGLSVADATSLLASGLSVEQGSMAEPALAELAMSVGGSPLALRLLNQNLRSRVHPGADPRAVARELQSDLASRGLNAIDSDYSGDEDSILTVLRQSAERLTPGDRACLPMLAGLKADAPIGIEQVSAITGLGVEETAGLVRRLEAVALVGTVGANQVVIHPIAQAFFRTLQHREQVATKTRIARATPTSFSIYISYARGDARDAARIYDRLVATFGAASVFIDKEAIRPGDRWMEVIEKAIRSARVMLVVIGRGWLETVHGDRSHIVHEIALALQSESTVIPILIQDMSMPSADRVPAALHRLTQLNALVLSNSQFQQDMDRLIEDLSDLAPRAAQPAPVSAPAGDPESAPKAPVGTASPAPHDTLQLAPRSRRGWVLGAVAAGVALLALPFVYRNASVSPPTGSLPGQSEFETAESYYFGRGVPQNAETALQWYRKSAELGYPSAQNALGRMYELGQGVPQDLTQARRWYELAAKQGHPDAKAALLRMK